jgi:hypothetical protein
MGVKCRTEGNQFDLVTFRYSGSLVGRLCYALHQLVLFEFFLWECAVS